jgi:hypothetical protein
MVGFSEELKILDEESKYYRVTHAGDPIPLVPASLAGFRHPNTEYYIADSHSSSTSTIVKCDPSSSNTCSESQTSLVLGGVADIIIALLGIVEGNVATEIVATLVLTEYIGAHLNYLMDSLGNC